MNLNEHFENYKINPSELLLAEVLKASQFFIYSIAIKVIFHKQDAEDLTQDVLIKTIKNINLLPKNTNFIGWLNRIALNAAIDFYHQKKRIKTLSPGYQEFKKNSPDKKDDETIVIIYQHLAKLDGIEESLILNKFIHQMTYAQLTNLHKLPRSTIESKINNILSKLKISVEKAGFAGVALALASTLDQLKATEVVFDLLPKVKDSFPSSYPKAQPMGHASKIFSKSLILTSSVATILLICGGLFFMGEQDGQPLTKLKNMDIPLEKTSQTIVDAEATKVYSKNKIEAANKSTEKEPNPAKDSIVLPLTNSIQSTSLKTEYAGQLLDAVTKEPIAGAKLEIWDIYSYKKTETTTDEEGKYDIPKDIDTTFFFFLRFLKEGYNIKQTFQHFSIQTKITVLLTKEEQTSGYLLFDEPTNGVIYIGMDLDLNEKQHLSNNQKQNLAKIFNIIFDTAPIEIYTFKNIKMDVAKEYFIKNIPFKNFVIWREESNKRGSNGPIHLNREKEILKVFHKKEKLYFPLNDSNNYSLESSKTGKLLTNKDLKIFDLDTRTEIFEKVGQKNKLENIFVNILEHSILTIEDIDYYTVTKQEPYYTVAHESKDFRALQLIPYSSISFEPLSLERKFHNSQIIFENNFFSKNSIFKKCKERSGVLKVFDMYFEEQIYKVDIKSAIGGNININHEISSNSPKKLTISITINNNQLKNTNIEIYNDEGLNADYKLPEEIKLDSNGLGLFNRQKSIQKIKIEFQLNKIKYFKIIDLSQISNDQIKLTYNKSISIQVSQDLINSYAKANAIVPDNKDYLSSNQISNIFFFSENSYIAVPFSEKSVFVEEDTEYTVSDAGYSIKTDFSNLKAINSINIKSHVKEVEIKPISDTDYIAFKAKFVDQNGNEVKTRKWFITEDCLNNRDNISSYFNYPNVFNPLEFRDIDEDQTKKSSRSSAITEEEYKKGTVQLINNRRYAFCVMAEGYVTYLEYLNIKDVGQVNKIIVLNKPNSIKFNGDISKLQMEMEGFLICGDVLYEYNGQQINDKESYLKARNECLIERVVVKLIRNNKSMSLTIPAFQIYGLESYYYDGKENILNKGAILDDTK